MASARGCVFLSSMNWCWLVIFVILVQCLSPSESLKERNTRDVNRYMSQMKQGDSWSQRQSGLFGNRYHYDWDERTTQIPLPGILAGWRTDLQGRNRSGAEFLDKYVTVNTAQGEIHGFLVYLYDNPDPLSGYRPDPHRVDRILRNTSVFLGIPYAQPPINEGRFKPPRYHPGWKVHNAVDFGPACPQPVQYIGYLRGIRTMDEDCLYLNVYTPTTVSGLPSRYPVMVYIHGGDFYKGASNTFPAHMMAAFYDVVVVTLNYRLGALGFLSTADENSPGNYGILDQAMALQWIHNNIEYFNGNKELITLFGPGAGAASAGLLMVAPRSRHLIKRVIAQSGSAMADWALLVDKYRAQNTSRVYGEKMGCSIDSSWKLVSCLRHRSFQELANTEIQPDLGTLPWGPVLDANFTVPNDDWYTGWRKGDWQFLPDTPENMIKRGDFNLGIEYMCGVTHDEAAYMIYNNKSLEPHFEITEEFFDKKIWEFIKKYNYTLNPEGIYNAVKYMYTYWPDPKNKTHIREQYVNMLSDFFYRAPNDQMVKLLVEKNIPVYIYVLNTTVETLEWPYWRRVPHDTEYYFLTGAPFMDVEFFAENLRVDRYSWKDADRNMSHFFMKAFTDFARYGSPTFTQILGIHFEMARNGDLKYLNLNTTFNSSIKYNYRQTEASFWTYYLPTVVGRLVPTYPPVTEYWWEPKEPLQIAFWSVAGVCLLCIVLVVIACILWRNEKRRSDLYYARQYHGDDGEVSENQHVKDYEYRDTPPPPEPSFKMKSPVNARKTASTPSLRTGTGSTYSLKETTTVGKEKIPVPIKQRHVVPQTEV